MTKRKKHLKYRAQHGNQTNPGPVDQQEGHKAANDAPHHKVGSGSHGVQKESKKQKEVSPKKLSALDAQSIWAVRQELVHLLVAASVIMIVYAGLWLLLARAGLEAKLTSLIHI